MIKNIVFDMGQVLMKYEPLRVCYQYTKDPQEIEQIRRELFDSREWILLDQGVITEEEALVRVKSRLPEKLHCMAEQCLTHWHEYNMEPREGMEELIRGLKEKGYRIYLCSNASHRLRVFLPQIPGSACFDGVLVSAEEQLLKPDPAIYRRLFEKYSIQPQESFFIDDLAANIEGARSCGMDGYCFADGEVERLKAYLEGYLGSQAAAGSLH